MLCEVTKCSRHMHYRVFPSMIEINFSGTDFTPSVSNACNKSALFVLHIDPSAVARDHGMGASGYVNSLSRQMSCTWHSMRSYPRRFLSAFTLTVFCLLDASCFCHVLKTHSRKCQDSASRIC